MRFNPLYFNPLYFNSQYSNLSYASCRLKRPHSFVMKDFGRYRLPYSTELNEIAY